jgi:RimJ/RimL family protein N-acetyltransferase
LDPINKYNIKLRVVEETDAAFIVAIRTDTSKSRFISETNSDVEKQKLWISEYKKREKAEEEFYLIAIDEEEVEFATYRLYDKRENSIEIGSFVSKPLYNNPINVIKVDVILKAYVFQELGFNNLKFEVRKENKSVVNYHKKFHPILIDEDELNYYFVLEKKAFLANKIKFEKLF